MSRRRRDRGDIDSDLLGGLQATEGSEPSPGLTASSIANEAYGSRVENPFETLNRSIRARPIPIDEIVPDAAQPRRALPSGLRQYWNGQPSRMGELFEMWLKEIEIERRGRPFDLDAYLQGEATERAPLDLNASDDAQHQAHPLEWSLLRIADLAASIYRDGLTNPITVAQAGTGYIIETGERRWMAYHLLHWRLGSLKVDGREDWSKIPARVVDQISIWRQASENNARADLNAIGKARQFALLLMDIYGNETFAPFEDFAEEQAFYAQVADGELWRIPRGKGELLLNAMGLRHPGQLRHYRRLLRLPPLVWQLADDLDWSESFVQKDLLAQAVDDAALVELASEFARAQGYSVSALTLSPPRKARKARARSAASGTLSKTARTRLRKLLALDSATVRAVEPEKRRTLLEDVDLLRRWLDEVEGMLRS